MIKNILLASLILSYSTLFAAAETTGYTSDTEVIYFLMDIDINKVVNIYSSTNYVSNTVSKYSTLSNMTTINCMI